MGTLRVWGLRTGHRLSGRVPRLRPKQVSAGRRCVAQAGPRCSGGASLLRLGPAGHQPRVSNSMHQVQVKRSVDQTAIGVTDTV